MRLTGRGEWDSAFSRIEFSAELGFTPRWLELRDAGTVEGTSGEDTGFDLDAVLISTTRCEDADCVGRVARDSSLPGAELYFRPGAMRGRSDVRLRGTDWSGTRIDEEATSLWKFDGREFLSMGERGAVAVYVPAGLPAASYVYVAEVGSHGGIAAETVRLADSPPPPPSPPASLASAGPCNDVARGFGEESLRERLTKQRDLGLSCLEAFADVSGDRDLVDKVGAILLEQVTFKCYEDPSDEACAWGGPTTIYINMARFKDCYDTSVLFHELMHVAGVPVDRGFHRAGDPVDRVYGCQHACFPISNDLDTNRNACLACNEYKESMQATCMAMTCQELNCEDGCVECEGKLRCGKKCDICYACPCDPDGHRPPAGDYVYYSAYDECMPKCIERTLSCFNTETACQAMPCP